MANKPILFNTEMVRAILSGRKTVTRRVVKLKHGLTNEMLSKLEIRPIAALWLSNIKAPYQPGDILYVRETWQPNPYGIGWPYFYKASPEQFDHTPDKWRPSIHMPKEAARLFLQVTDVRVERLQDMTEDDVVAEGAEPLIFCQNEHGVIEPDGTLGDMCWNTGCCGWHCKYIEKSYGELFGEIVWDSTIKPADRDKYGWDANPWVWVIGFERTETNKRTI